MSSGDSGVSRRRPHFKDLAFRRGAVGVFSPCLHQLAALKQRIAAPVVSLNSVADFVRQGRLTNFTLEAGHVTGPVPEGGPESMRGDIVALHPQKQFREGHLRKLLITVAKNILPVAVRGLDKGEGPIA